MRNPASRVKSFAAATSQPVTPSVTFKGGERAKLSLTGKGVSLRPWSPDDPYLYDITITAGSDTVKTYAGMRHIEVASDGKVQRLKLNGKELMMIGPLDQGFWPDGIYTAPTDDALRFDLERTKAMGMNFVRKHGKVEPARWYYWADKLGLMVWQDMPSLDVSLDIPVGPAPDPVPAAKANFEHELSAMVDQLRSVTSIIGWVVFNEGWGEYDTARVANAVKAEDPTRMVNANSGVNCCKSRPDSMAGDIYDDHTYVGPGRPVVNDERDDRAKVPDTQPVVVDRRVRVDGEYGGLGLVLDGNRWPGRPQAYEMADSQARLTERYVEVSRDLEKAVREGGLSGAIYTQTTDVENEVNGYLSYDRRLIKMALPTVAERNRAVIAAGTDPTDRR